MSGFGHGGDWAGFEREYGRAPLDFSANVNPLGMPPGARAAAEAALAQAGSYPDPHCRALREALSAAEGVPPEWILCGNGAADLIYRLAHALRPGRALVTAPSFSEYAAALRAAGCVPGYHPLREADSFALTPDILPRIEPGLDLLFLCEPANPTGQLTDPALLGEILARCADSGTLLVMDECFGAFLDQPGRHSLVPRVAAHPNLLVLKAFTKFYAMAGLRLGYALCRDEALLAALAAAGPPWPVSCVAQAAGAAALADRDYPEATRRLIREERAFLREGLEKAGCRVYGSRANYLFFRAPPGLGAALAEKGILLRDCENYPGLGPGWYRASVRLRAENTILLQNLPHM